MSLRSRALVAIALVLSIIAALGAVLAGVRAHSALRSELGVALEGAERSLHNELQAREAAEARALEGLGPSRTARTWRSPS